MNIHIRKIVSVILTLLFCVAVIIGVGVMLSVRNVNVEYVYHSSRGDQAFERAKEELQSLKGYNLALIGDEDVSSRVDGALLVVQSCEKVFPCTLNIVIRERQERYAAANPAGGYDMYDSEGGYMGTRAENINPSDSSPNILVSADEGGFPSVIAACNAFEQCFGSVRNMVGAVVLSYDKITDTRSMTLSLYRGLDIVIFDYDDRIGEKVAAAAECFSGLTESQKMRGSINVVAGGGARPDISSVYNPLI